LRPDLGKQLQTLPTVGGGVDFVAFVFQPTSAKSQKIGFILDD